MAEMLVARMTLKLAWSLFAPATASRLAKGDVAEERVRQMLLNEFQKIHEHLLALRRKELMSAISLLETGFELLHKDPCTSKEEFHKARENALMAFGVVADVSDKILATKILVLSTLREFHDNQTTARSLCLKYLERMNSLPEVVRTSEIVYSPEQKLSNKMMLFNSKTKRDALLRHVAEVNACVSEHFRAQGCLHLSPPSIRFSQYHVNPLTDLALHRTPKVVTGLPADLTGVIAVCCHQSFLFASLASDLKYDVIAVNLDTGHVSHLLAHENVVLSMVATSTRLFTASFDRTIIAWDARELSPLQTLKSHEGSVRTLCLSHQHLFSGSVDATVKVWSLCEPHECVATLNITKAVVKLQCSAHKFLFCLCGINDVQIWDAGKHVMLQTITASGQPYDIIPSNNQLYLPTKTREGVCIHSWNLGSLTPGITISADCRHVVKAQDASYLICAETSVKIYNVASGKLSYESEMRIGEDKMKCAKHLWMDGWSVMMLGEMVDGRYFVIKY